MHRQAIIGALAGIRGSGRFGSGRLGLRPAATGAGLDQALVVEQHRWGPLAQASLHAAGPPAQEHMPTPTLLGLDDHPAHRQVHRLHRAEGPLDLRRALAGDHDQIGIRCVAGQAGRTTRSPPGAAAAALASSVRTRVKAASVIVAARRSAMGMSPIARPTGSAMACAPAAQPATTRHSVRPTRSASAPHALRSPRQNGRSARRLAGMHLWPSPLWR